MFLYLLLVSFLVLPSIESATICEGQEDCNPDECCVKRIHLGYCRSLKKKGEFCYPEAPIVVGKESLYLVACPCAKGLDCVPEKIIEDGDEKIYRNPRCIEKE